MLVDGGHVNPNPLPLTFNVKIIIKVLIMLLALASATNVLVLAYFTNGGMMRNYHNITCLSGKFIIFIIDVYLFSDLTTDPNLIKMYQNQGLSSKL